MRHRCGRIGELHGRIVHSSRFGELHGRGLHKRIGELPGRLGELHGRGELQPLVFLLDIPPPS